MLAKQNLLASLLTSALTTINIPLVCANWKYKSRPDLSPPALNITIPATKDVEKGFLFVAPFAGYPEGTHHGPAQAAPYILTDTGDLVWSGFTYFSIWATNFQAARYKGQDILFSFEGSHNAAYGHGHGHTTFLNQNYETIKELRAGNHRLTDKHEFHIVNEETALIQIYHPVPWNLTAYGASEEQQWIVDSRFQELNIETGEVLYEWSSLDHVDPSEGYLKLNPGQAGAGYNSSDAWDYFHINSVDKDAEGNYLISARDANAAYKINGTTGEIIWQLSGKSTSFKLGHGVEFAFQHHARFVSKSQDGKKEVISLYDNSAHGTENGHGNEVHFYKYSRGKIIEVDTEKWEARLIQAFNPPDNLLSKSQGSTQLLPNGNALVNWGSEGAVTEFKSDGTPIFHAYLDSGYLGIGVENYRGFRYNWTGIPNEAPAIVALQDEETATTSIYVSWNGDTRTRRWRFYEVNSEGHRSFLGERKRESFETVLKLDQVEVNKVQAEALDARGVSLVSTSAVELEALIHEHKATERKIPKQEKAGLIPWLTFKGQKIFGIGEL
ncbi:ASST-domain-containing protein [Bisporella sp. PMI_857]|nr:ASST-domain-containing protein [Bisporella sp. PMI_857]